LPEELLGQFYRLYIDLWIIFTTVRASSDLFYDILICITKSVIEPDKRHN